MCVRVCVCDMACRVEHRVDGPFTCLPLASSRCESGGQELPHTGCCTPKACNAALEVRGTHHHIERP